jgi:hypothetical protein
MQTGLQHLHSYLAYLVLAGLIISAIVFLLSRGGSFKSGHKKLALITLILTHLQLVIGLVLYFVGPLGYQTLQLDDVMSTPELRLYAVEHISINIIGVILITIGYSTAKRSSSSKAKFTKLGIFYGIGLVLILSRIPWSAWL